jgi:hypothetical protein
MTMTNDLDLNYDLDYGYSLFPIPYSLFPIPYSLLTAQLPNLH